MGIMMTPSLGEGKELEKQNFRVVSSGAIAMIMLAGGAAAVYMVIKYSTPIDLYSTSLWYDRLGINLAAGYESNFYQMISGYKLPTAVSMESVVVSLLMFLAQILLAVQYVKAGGWLVKEPQSARITWLTLFVRAMKGKVRAEAVNWDKVAYGVPLLGLGMFDTGTDAGWKTVGTIAENMDLFLRNYAISWLINNMLSEWMLVTGLVVAIGGLQMLIRSKFVEELVTLAFELLNSLFGGALKQATKPLQGLAKKKAHPAARAQQQKSVNNNKTTNNRQKGASKGARQRPQRPAPRQNPPAQVLPQDDWVVPDEWVQPDMPDYHTLVQQSRQANRNR